MIVMKFGGSSVANAERFRSVSEIVRSQLDKKPVVVLSAMGDTTDHLIDAAEQALSTGPVTVEQSLELITSVHLNTLRDLGLTRSVPPEIRELLAELGSLLAGISLIGELSPRSRDFLVSFGERLSVRIAEMYFCAQGITAKALDAWDAGILSDGNWTQAEILEESRRTVPAALAPLLEKNIVPVVTGFIAKNKTGGITTLGRGGSDLTATFIASACTAEEVQVWKDVDGIMTCDPRVISHARPVAQVTYDEAAELAYFGAQVLHPRAMLPCSMTGTPVLVKNSYNPTAPGTRISTQLERGVSAVRALTSRRGVTLVDIVSARMLGQSGFLGEVFAAFARHKISVDMVATSEVSVSVTLDSCYNLDDLTCELSRIARVEAKDNMAIVTIICDVRRSSQILERAFARFGALNVQVQMISQGASKVNISFIVNSGEAETAIRGLHREFFEAA
ncbi:MAG: aspartate kinase [Spirochaetaceae bacterium]|jgi:aspartate kinase|nr:aspartate kinase [Spirochaetaceae bacterium]